MTLKCGCVTSQWFSYSVLPPTRGYPCLTSPHSMYRRRGGDEVTLKQSEDVASLKLHRVHGDHKRNASLAHTKENIKSLESRSNGLKWRQGAMAARGTTDLTGIRWSQHTFNKSRNTDQREVEQRHDRSVLPVGRGHVKERGHHTDALVE
jgi:hypothetical protein